MASTKRVSGNYDIYTDLLTIYGNLNVEGTTTTVNTEIVDVSETITGNLYINGPLYAGGGGGAGNVGEYLLSTGSTVYWGSAAGSTPASGTNRSIQFNNSSYLGGDATFNFYANGNVQIGNSLISNTAIYSSTANNDVKLFAAGTGVIYVQDVLKLDFQTGTTPTNVASTVQLLANTPGQGGTGLFVVNSNYSDELISKRKATWLGLVFS
jgi:hypothetical protein